VESQALPSANAAVAGSTGSSERPRDQFAAWPWLAAILLLAAGLRLAGLANAPPGLNQDEAVNAWNAWCLLKTGHDQTGAPWPIFYMHALGENRSTLFVYTLLPFEALGGLNVWTNRLPAAVGGVLTVLLMYWIGAKLFNRPTGLVAAALLALSPWHIQLSRLGHEAALGPLLVTLSLAALLWAGFPLHDGQPRPSWWKALLAGLVAGSACYGYPAVRLFLPAFLLGCVLVNGHACWNLLRGRAGLLAGIALLVGVGVTFGPLAYHHLAQPEVLAKRAANIWLWEDSDPLAVRATKILARYAAHFGPDFLFVSGDQYEVQGCRGFGELQWYTLPLLVGGVVAILRTVRTSRAARVALVWLILYPLGDCVARHESLHALRSAPGLGGLVLLAAVGAVTIGAWLWRHRRRAALPALAVLALLAIVLDGRFLLYFFGEHTRRPLVYRNFHVELVEACDWLRPRLAQADAVFITTAGMTEPYVVTLVALGYDARQWFRDQREILKIGEWEHYARVGKLHFLYDPDASQKALAELRKNGRADRVIFIVRPGELKLRDPVRAILAPNGQPLLLIYEETM
jgi:4-amino-4-deoxy-L-arabinose transferase-like glycosyltransferase